MNHARLWIDGEWRDALAGTVAEVISPATGEVVGAYADAGVADGRQAVAAARLAFEGSAWSRSPKLRAATLLGLAQALEHVIEPMAADVSGCNGKLIGEARHEVAAGVSELTYYAGLARNIFGRDYQEFQRRGGNVVYYNRYAMGTSLSASVSVKF